MVRRNAGIHGQSKRFIPAPAVATHTRILRVTRSTPGIPARLTGGASGANMGRRQRVLAFPRPNQWSPGASPLDLRRARRAGDSSSSAHDEGGRE